ncbi:hypothetical protein C1N81_31060 [Streptomyces sp. SGAir0957]
MCIRVQYAPRDLIREPYDADRRLITIPDVLAGSVLYAHLAVRAVLRQLDVEQDAFGARCWCGEPIRFLTLIPQQRRSDEVINLGA